MLEIEAVVLISLKIIFMYGAMQDGEVFGPDGIIPIRKFLEWFVSLFPVKAQLYLRKPLFDCMFCMSSVWGLTFYFLPLPLWLDIILSVAGLNYLWSALVGYLHAAKDEAKENVDELQSEIKEFKERVLPGFHSE